LRVGPSAVVAVFESWNQFLGCSGRRGPWGYSLGYGMVPDPCSPVVRTRAHIRRRGTPPHQRRRLLESQDLLTLRKCLSSQAAAQPGRLCAGRVRPDCSCRRSTPTAAASPRPSAIHPSSPSESRTTAPLAMWPARAAQPWSTGGSQARVERTRFGGERSRPLRWRQHG
jgi:hypothetical protein